MRVKAYKAFSDYAIIFLVQIRKGIKFTMNRQEKRALWHKKQDKAKVQQSRQERLKQLDKQFIYNQTKLQDNKANKKLKDLHNMKKSNYIFSLAISAKYDKEVKELIKENLASTVEKGKGFYLASDKASETFVTLLEKQEKLLEAVKAFGIKADNWKELQEMISFNTQQNDKFETLAKDINNLSENDLINKVKEIIEKTNDKKNK